MSGHRTVFRARGMAISLLCVVFIATGTAARADWIGTDEPWVAMGEISAGGAVFRIGCDFSFSRNGDNFFSVELPGSATEAFRDVLNARAPVLQVASGETRLEAEARAFISSEGVLEVVADGSAEFVKAVSSTGFEVSLILTSPRELFLAQAFAAPQSGQILGLIAERCP